MTSASTHPPPTEPIRRPAAPTSILVPAGTGVEPRTLATVASAPGAPSRIRAAAACHTFIPEILNSRSMICPGSSGEGGGWGGPLLRDDRAVHPRMNRAMEGIGASRQLGLIR